MRSELSSSPSPLSLPLNLSEDESDDGDSHDHFDDDEDEDGSVTDRLSSCRESRRVFTAFCSKWLAIPSRLGDILAPVIRASSSRLHHHDADSEPATSISSHSERVRESRARNDISSEPYVVLFYGDEDESSQDNYVVKEVASEFLGIQDNQVVLRLGQLFDWWLTLVMDETTSFPPRMSDFLQLLEGGSTAWYAYRLSMGFHVFESAVLGACALPTLHISLLAMLASDIFVVFAVAEIPRLWSPSVQLYQHPAPGITAKQDLHNALYVVLPETCSFLYTSTTHLSSEYGLVFAEI
ncbi:hypothetical protein EDD18DRAFT_1359074 [Armillaria luteobubalina]|uniref:Uncharacterized protein n=1 Tax=Armillaria luteobubalina TaxID=153913 RepID=A0AA39PV96_9AGAR|nr:hypothetical protein EDD18DRAFT_1359074 [Armillaria luteobubalina]